MKLVNKYIPFFKVGVHQSIAYKTNWLFIIVGNILNCFVSFYLWKAIFDSNKSKSFLGFSLEEMIVYIFVTFITSDGRENYHNIRQKGKTQRMVFGEQGPCQHGGYRLFRICG